MRIPKRLLIDTNIPIKANNANILATVPFEEVNCIKTCYDFIDSVIKKNCIIILDTNNEILNEYKHHLSFSGQPGIGDRFLKWLHDNMGHYEMKDRVSITRNGNTYKQYPDHPSVQGIDISDKKFFAVINAHPDNPPIYEGTDCKWWGWKNNFSALGIRIIFLDEKYISDKYADKILNKQLIIE